MAHRAERVGDVDKHDNQRAAVCRCVLERRRRCSVCGWQPVRGTKPCYDGWSQTGR